MTAVTNTNRLTSLARAVFITVSASIQAHVVVQQKYNRIVLLD